MPRRTIKLPDLKRPVPLGVYVAAIKRAKAEPETEFKRGLTTWWPTTGAEIVRQFHKGMHERINDGISYQHRGARR